jgi:hypothetical protein
MENNIIIHKSETSDIAGINIIINGKVDKLLSKEALDIICTKDAKQIYTAFCKYLPIFTLSKLQDLINTNEYL